MNSLLLLGAAALESAVLARQLFVVSPVSEVDGPAAPPRPAPRTLDDEDTQRQINDLIRAGNQIGATYLQQQLTGDGFTQARSTIEALAARLSEEYQL